jgi:hypothetical protein
MFDYGNSRNPMDVDIPILCKGVVSVSVQITNQCWRPCPHFHVFRGDSGLAADAYDIWLDLWLSDHVVDRTEC